jgi:arylformamidase
MASPGLAESIYNLSMIYDVSVPIQNGMPVWPSDPPVKLTANNHLSRDKSHTVRVTSIEMGSHTGTHVDAPAHFVEGGKTLSEIPLDVFVGPATVFEMPGVRSIARSDLENLDWTGVERVLFKTDNSAHWNDGRFFEEFVYLEPEAGEFLVSRGVRLVGIDYLSIDRFRSEKHPTHFALLPHDVVLLEGLNLSKIFPGRYRMVALPLNLQQADGAPTRVILIDDN